jgi:hypothetical protein
MDETMRLVIFGGAAGVLLVIWVVHVTGGSRPLKIASADSAKSLFAADWPELEAGRADLADGARAALIDLGEAGAGLVRVVGAHVATARLTPSELKQARWAADGRLVLRFHDLAVPDVHLSLDDPAAAKAWAVRLSQETRRAA